MPVQNHGIIEPLGLDAQESIQCRLEMTYVISIIRHQ